MSVYGDGGAPLPPMDGTEPCVTADPEIFFTSSSTDRETARGLCAQCHVREQCREYALTHAVSGLWAGLTRAERHTIQQERKLRPVPVLPATLDPQMVIRAHQRGIPNQKIARIADTTLVSVEQVLAAWRKRQRDQAAAS